MDSFKILAIDTSCDDTSVAITDNRKVLANCVSSQIEMHRATGGVIPIEAARAHDIKLDPLIEFALKRAKVEQKDLNAIAVTYGPGLAPALETGIVKAKKLAQELQIPLIPVNHMSGHAYANWAQNSKGNNGIQEDKWPVICLLISGGHTEIVYIRNHFDFEIIGETLDDACGECFDKVGRMLGLGYPAGPVMERLAEDGDEQKYSLPRPMSNTPDLNVSYSGLKTACFRLIKSIADQHGISSHHYLQNQEIALTEPISQINTITQDKVKAPPGTEVYNLSKQEICDISASFQKAAIETILIKVEKAIKTYPAKMLILGGGVVKNKYLRKKARQIASKYNIDFSYPSNKLIVDNAAMIGIAAYYQYISRKTVLETPETQMALDRKPSLRL